jgi:biotin synthase-related radical SAM superfamily protein
VWSEAGLNGQPSLDPDAVADKQYAVADELGYVDVVADNLGGIPVVVELGESDAIVVELGARTRAS